MRIHFIAIGGSIMHNLAINLAEQGHQVSGSDDQIVEPSKSRLEKAHLFPKALGWYPEKITEELDAILLGKHAVEDNPELLKARELGIKIYSYPEFVYEQSVEKTRVVIAGTYGKTTVTSMVMHVLREMNVEFDYLVGAQLEGFDSLVKLTSTSPLIIIEGDEYYASTLDNRSKFHLYHPNIALITGIEWDSFKTQISSEDYFEQFRKFIESITPKGTLIYNKDNTSLHQILEDTKDLKINRHGYKLPDYSINKGITSVTVCGHDYPLKVFGKHNLANIVGAYTVCEWLGIKRAEFYQAIQSFKSSIRYLEFVASRNGSVVYQDFAHTPARLRSSIHAIKEQFPNQALVTFIELSPYDSMENNILMQYEHSMQESDHAVAFVNLNTYKENNIPKDALEKTLSKAFDHPSLHVMTDVKELEQFLESFQSNGHNLLFMSSNTHSGVNMASFADKFLKES
ncbi:Mur ligase family protein [Sphingobacterium corticis]|uniref:Mur ligase family protein n=1 Tax=Sphingobacterium corticis TaxID=1812823 RepID=A0ABW5NMX8_9SPHI